MFLRNSRLYRDLYTYNIDRSMHPTLGSFIRSLGNKGLLTFDVTGETEEHFENRLKLQKYVYLASYFGLDMDYRYNMYLRGPYSPGLAEDYYTLGSSGFESPLAALPDDFNHDAFMNLVNGKDSAWLEIAATILSLRKSFNDRTCLLERTVNMKGRFGRDKIETIMRELEQNNLLTF